MRVLRKTRSETRRERHQGNRLALATVELAVCLPMAVTLVVGTVEASNAIFTKQSLKIAAYESARIATSTRGTKAQAIARAQEVLTSRGITKVRIRVVPAVTERTPRGTPVRVTIQMRARDASYASYWFSKRARFLATVRMVRL